MAKEHHVVIVPGLDGRIWGINFATHRWPRKFGLIPHAVQILWKDGLPLDPKLAKIVATTEPLLDEGHDVSLIGTSAGGIGVLLAAGLLPDIKSVVNMCGFSLPGTGTGRYSFEKRSQSSPAFKEGILRHAQIFPSLKQKDLAKILVLRAKWDELVHPSANFLPGATNIELPWKEHIYAIGRTLWNYKPMIDFLKSK